MDRPDTFDAIVAGLRAAGWQLHRSGYRGGVLASTSICHGGSSPDKLSIWPRDDGGFQAKCWTAGCEGPELYAAIRQAAGVENRQIAAFPAPGGLRVGSGSENRQNEASRATAGVFSATPSRQYAQKLWKTATPLPINSQHPARRWLTARNLWRPEFPAPALLRWLPGAPRWASWAVGCLAAPIATVDAWADAWPSLPTPLALARVAVDRDGGRPAGAADKRTLGRVDGPAAVLIGRPPVDGGIIVCEGLADAVALAAHGPELLADCPPLADAAPPVLALAGTSGMRGAGRSGLAAALAASGVVVVAADSDDAGRPTPPPGLRAALALARAVEAAGGRAVVCFARVGKDAAAAARSGGFPPLATPFADYGRTLRAMESPPSPRWDTARRADIETREE